MKKRIFATLLAFLMVAALLPGCGKAEGNPDKTKTDQEQTGKEKKDKFVIGFSQATMNHPFRVAMVDENVAYAKEHYPEIEVIMTDGQNDSAIQVQNVEDLLARGIDLLLISPHTSEALTPVCEEAMKKGIPVVTLDRNVETEVTCFIGAENKPMGVAAADKFAKALNNKGRIIEIQGTAGASATIDRHDGFAEELKAKYPEMEIIATQYCDYVREDAMQFMDDTLQRFGPGEIDAIYCHNDEMALGALEALRTAGRSDEGILISGMDGTEVAFAEIQKGNMFFSVVYPYCAPEGMQAAYKILKGEHVDKIWKLDTAVVDGDNISEWIGRGL